MWCHPKFSDVSDRSFRVWVHSVAYSTGFHCRGVLTTGQQATIGSTPKARRELVASGLWDDLPEGSIAIHDWDVHNSKRDARRASDRERKRRARSAGQSAGTSTVSARVDGSEGSEGSDKGLSLVKGLINDSLGAA